MPVSCSPPGGRLLRNQPCLSPSAEVRFLTGAVAELIVFTPVEPGRLRVRWTDRSAGRLGFQLDRDAGSGFLPVITLPASTQSFDDTMFPLGRYALPSRGAGSLEVELRDGVGVCRVETQRVICGGAK